jgi:hypothetical protein
MLLCVVPSDPRRRAVALGPSELLCASFSDPATIRTFPVRRSVAEIGLIGIW